MRILKTAFNFIKLKKKKSNKLKLGGYFPFIVLCSLSIFVVCMWFRRGMFIGGGESSMHLYNLKNYINIYKWFWIDKGLGAVGTLTFPKIPLLFLISMVPSINIVWLHQALFFIIIIFSALIGLYLFTLELIGEKSTKIAAISSFFYLLNPYAVSQIFGRFIYAGMAAWGFLPLFLFLLLKWLREGRKYFIPIIILFFITISYVFSQPSYILVYWPAAFILLMAEVIINKKKTARILFRFTELFILWFLVNIWWIYPYLSLGSDNLASAGGFKFNYDSLKGVSKYATLKYLLTLRQGFYIGKGGQYYPYYSKLFVVLSSIIALATASVGWVSTKGKKYRIHLSLLALAGWFISKGVNPPLGSSFYKFLFTQFPISFGLRNPYEKFGVVWLFVYSILFGLGIIWIIKIFKNIKFKYFISAIFLVIFVLLGKPILDGTTFPRNLYILIPSYYSELNNVLKNEAGDGRVLLEPIRLSTGTLYSWGYNGLEPSDYLIDRPVLGKATVSLADPIQNNLRQILVSDEKFSDFLKNLNVSYIIFNNDYLSTEKEKVQAEETKEYLNENDNFIKMGTYGSIDLYKYLGNENGSLIEAKGENPPKITYIKKSPIEYRVSVLDAELPFKLYFKNRYHRLWVASINNMVLSHEMVYDYANSWDINKVGDYTISITFKILPWEYK